MHIDMRITILQDLRGTAINPRQRNFPIRKVSRIFRFRKIEKKEAENFPIRKVRSATW